MKRSVLIFAGIALLTMKAQAQTVTDYDFNIYNTVTIGTQIWLKENLKVTHYCNGNSISNVTDSATWETLTTEAYCNYKNNNDSANIYGRLYNWFAVDDSRGLCPYGWHVASDSDWTVLTDYLGGIDIAGGKLKEIGVTHWASPNTGATNISGFTALPGGGRYWMGFEDVRSLGYWWSSTSTPPPYDYNARNRAMHYNSTIINTTGYPKQAGFSVRCICDSTASSVKEINNIKGIIIYPNPATDRIIIDFANEQNSNISVYNFVGELVLQRELNNTKEEIDISTLQTGIYLMIVTGVDWTVQQKIIKE